jgi:hypothetical protein
MIGWRILPVVRSLLHGVVDFLGADCCEGCVESCCIFLFDSRKMGQSLVRWLISLSWNM